MAWLTVRAHENTTLSRCVPKSAISDVQINKNALWYKDKPITKKVCTFLFIGRNGSLLQIVDADKSKAFSVDQKKAYQQWTLLIEISFVSELHSKNQGCLTVEVISASKLMTMED